MKKLILLIFLILLLPETFGQKKEELLKERDKTNQDIEFTNKLLQETIIKRESSYEELLLVNSKIRLRNRIIDNLNLEIRTIDNEIRKNEEVISSLEDDLKKVKEEYAELVRKAYKMRNDRNNLMYILAAKNFNQAYKRLRYLKKFTDYRKKQMLLIRELNKTIQNQNKTLESKKNERIRYVNDKLKERNELVKDKSSKNLLVNELNIREDELRAELKKMKSIAEKLNKSIEELIAATEKEGKFMKLTPEQKLISTDFLKNKGRFPWPTKYGVVTGEFGEHPHPVLKGIKIRNNGIDIATMEGSEVRALFNGEVSRVFSIKGANNTVIIRHGKYFTVYHNIIDVVVKVGDMVMSKDVIGRVYTDNSTKSTVLHFEIWNETEKMNPKEWLSN